MMLTADPPLVIVTGDEALPIPASNVSVLPAPTMTLPLVETDRVDEAPKVVSPRRSAPVAPLRLTKAPLLNVAGPVTSSVPLLTFMVPAEPTDPPTSKLATLRFPPLLTLTSAVPPNG